jgi:hypothetical protein
LTNFAKYPEDAKVIFERLLSRVSHAIAALRCRRRFRLLPENFRHNYYELGDSAEKLFKRLKFQGTKIFFHVATEAQRGKIKEVLK